ncbi:dehydrogenase/reductase SDR family member on chromosome X isoform X2 [Medicago truncatula]|uniref:Rossmann-fold NAD(P)-binding domain protein n=1 Tax=Medicago truncatula TaxID=3880 RepID=G7J0B4_MEDTR|nr:dehydrogenase/reductase SDR family member on chromosome X isoform X2 [Medicago truncatula]AES68518.2 rossmann-fold NAD(P)-binding domain protein [Medicago truncatula]
MLNRFFTTLTDGSLYIVTVFFSDSNSKLFFEDFQAQLCFLLFVSNCLAAVDLWRDSVHFQIRVIIKSQATSGLGLSTACKLSKEGYVVVIVGRSEQLLSEAITKIKGWNEDAHLKAFQADLSSVESIIKFSTSLRQWLLDSDLHCSVQILINNAGILATSPRVTTEGYDKMIATNYIGPFVMTKLLLPLLESSPVSSKIVNVTSFTHRAVTNMQVDEGTVSGKRFLKSKQYPYAQIYEYSKLCLLLFSYELHRQLCQMGKSHQIFVNVADPGVVQTNIMREVPASLSWVAFFVLKRLRLLESFESGNDSIIDAALTPPGTSGVYFFGGKGRTINSSALSQDTKLAHELWETTSDLLSVTPFGNKRNNF